MNPFVGNMSGRTLTHSSPPIQPLRPRTRHFFTYVRVPDRLFASDGPVRGRRFARFIACHAHRSSAAATRATIREVDIFFPTRMQIHPAAWNAVERSRSWENCQSSLRW